MGGMRLLLPLIASLIFTACREDAPAKPHRPQYAPKPHIAGTIELPNEDGRVYVIESPTSIPINNVTCFLHVNKQGTSTIACTPPRMELSPPEPAER